MEFFKQKTHFDFIGHLRPMLTVSLSLVVISLVLVFTKGLNFGIEFAGGSEALVVFSEPTALDEVRPVCDAVGLDQPELVRYGLVDEGRYLVRTRTRSVLTVEETQRVRAAVVAKFGEPTLWDTTDETGEIIRVRFEKTATQEELEAAARESGIDTIEIGLQSAGTNPIFQVRMPSIRDRLAAGLQARFGEKFLEIERMESVGSAVGAQLRNQGILALLYAMIGILLYIAFRFDLKFGPGALFALIHDATITVGVFALFGLEFNLQIIAALLAIIGYSVNDTVVVYDRIRETMRKVTGKSMGEIINISINQTISRTIITSTVTEVAVLATLIFGGAVTRGFAIAMTVGILVGTASSIVIAAPCTLYLEKFFEKKQVAAPKAVSLSKP